MSITSPPAKVVVICPVIVLTLLLHVLGVAPVAVMTPDEDTVPESKRMLRMPLVMGRLTSLNTPLSSVAVNVPVAVPSPQAGQVELQLPV